MSCIVKNCGNTRNKYDDGITFHQFPKNPQRRAVWLKNCNLSAADIKTQSKICSVHFSPICFKVQDGCNRVLNSDAEPTIFVRDTTIMPTNEVVKVEPTEDIETDPTLPVVPQTVRDVAIPSTTLNVWSERPESLINNVADGKPTENDESYDSLERISIRISADKTLVKNEPVSDESSTEDRKFKPFSKNNLQREESTSESELEMEFFPEIKKEPPDEDRKFDLSPTAKQKMESSPELDRSTTDTDVEMRYLTLVDHTTLVYAPPEEDAKVKPKRRRSKKPRIKLSLKRALQSPPIADDSINRDMDQARIYVLKSAYNKKLTQVRTLQQRNNRLSKKISFLEAVVTDLRSKIMDYPDLVEMLKSGAGPSAQLFSKKTRRKIKGDVDTEEEAKENS